MKSDADYNAGLLLLKRAVIHNHNWFGQAVHQLLLWSLKATAEGYGSNKESWVWRGPPWVK
jgi:hypothetical protein